MLFLQRRFYMVKNSNFANKIKIEVDGKRKK